LIKDGKLVACGSLEDLSRQVGLPVRTRLNIAAGQAARMTEQLEPNYQLEKLNEHTLELVCPADQKIAMLRHVADLGDAVLDISMSAPRLNEIYLHYMNGDNMSGEMP
jgi:Cu-processing system ATP-binding protein